MAAATISVSLLGLVFERAMGGTQCGFGGLVSGRHGRFYAAGARVGEGRVTYLRAAQQRHFKTSVTVTLEFVGDQYL